MSDFTRAEVCAVAIADAFRGDGEILASFFGTVPAVGGRLARMTFEPDLLMTDGKRRRRRRRRRGASSGQPSSSSNRFGVSAWSGHRSSLSGMPSSSKSSSGQPSSSP